MDFNFLSPRRRKIFSPRVGFSSRRRPASCSRRRGACRQGGFTLIELLLVCVIVIIISSLIVIDSKRFGGAVTLENLAYDFALSTRQAQVYGIGVHRFGAGTFSSGYGIHVKIAGFDAPNWKYYMFADTAHTGVCEFNCFDSPELIQTMTLQSGFSIVKLCAPAQANTAACLDASVTSASSADVVFVRPEPDAYISINGNATFSGGLVVPANLKPSLQIVLQSPKGDDRSVIIYAAGQISVQ